MTESTLGFLLRCLRSRGFGEKWCCWIENVLKNGTVAVKLNDTIEPYFQSYKGVRQGDSLSPMLFNFLVDCLTRMIIRAQQNGLITGLMDNLFSKTIVVLQYAGDTIICLKDDIDKARNLKLLLSVYEQMSGLKINFEKSEVLTIGGDSITAVVYADIFTCQIAMFPLKYIGVPISARRLRVIDWCKLEEKLVKK
jgi:hypothetical protein